ncbi:MAG: hypothetical protein NTY53_10645 [Kiritimatiellaeota bacterium]|nr:hypothetical protein [Kiritimatiellota bacterium]
MPIPAGRDNYAAGTAKIAEILNKMVKFLVADWWGAFSERAAKHLDPNARGGLGQAALPKKTG